MRFTTRFLRLATTISAALLGIALVAVSFVAVRTMRLRDAAVREGILLRVAHDIEGRFRQQNPEVASAQLPLLCDEFRDRVAGIEVANPGGRSLRCGSVGDGALEMPIALGPGWRAYLGGSPEQRRGPPTAEERRMGPPFRIRLQPADSLADTDAIATTLLGGSTLVAIILVSLALVASRTLARTEKLAAVESERQRLEVVARAGAGLAHRIRNPLAGIKGTAQMLERCDGAKESERARRIVEATTRIETLLDELLHFAKPSEPRPEVFDVGPVIAEIAAASEGATVAGESSSPVLAFADPEHVRSAIEELVRNAVSLDESKAIEIAARIDGDLAVVEVRDRGAGLQIAADDAFKPYVTTRPDGTGLGLPTIRALVEANGGRVDLGPRDGGGCVARISLPLGRG